MQCIIFIIIPIASLPLATRSLYLRVSILTERNPAALGSTPPTTKLTGLASGLELQSGGSLLVVSSLSSKLNEFWLLARRQRLMLRLVCFSLAGRQQRGLNGSPRGRASFLSPL